MKEPARFLQFSNMVDTKAAEGVAAMTMRIGTFYTRKMDEVFLEGVTRIAKECGITTAIVINREAMAEVLRLGMEAYERKEKEEDGFQELAGREE